MFVLRGFGGANYGLFVLAVTALVVFLIAVTGVAPKDVMIARGLNTTIGGLITLLAYWVWPTWERYQFPEALAQLLDAYRTYFHSISDSYLHPQSDSRGQLEQTGWRRGWPDRISRHRWNACNRNRASSRMPRVWPIACWQLFTGWCMPSWHSRRDWHGAIRCPPERPFPSSQETSNRFSITQRPRSGVRHSKRPICRIFEKPITL